MHHFAAAAEAACSFTGAGDAAGVVGALGEAAVGNAFLWMECVTAPTGDEAAGLRATPVVAVEDSAVNSDMPAIDVVDTLRSSTSGLTSAERFL